MGTFFRGARNTLPYNPPSIYIASGVLRFSSCPHLPRVLFSDDCELACLPASLALRVLRIEKKEEFCQPFVCGAPLFPRRICGCPLVAPRTLQGACAASCLVTSLFACRCFVMCTSERGYAAGKLCKLLFPLKGNRTN